jgi:hypothetical protein
MNRLGKYWIHLIHRQLNVRDGFVSVAFEHAQVLVADYPLHNGQMHASPHRMRDCFRARIYFFYL